ncbi:GGDEF domain-containing protein [Calidithermus roseus]|uniref:Putative diguanylate cyclase YdaM n=1 Tax=Calidithermus roseus TaxID=1644118 RepID=A0A399F5B5_9DEIN|nr:GGDEF domain-containing protein [Calidithermus roseus]RIH89811.1 putative diguanylate cyclase YdaM [Calidithermus roseus]
MEWVGGLLLGALIASAGWRVAYLRVLEQSCTDSLTGLPNRRGLERALARELTLAERSGEPLCLVLFDLDAFKRVNDTFGHAAGDKALRLVARVAREKLRRSDWVGRWGGEEFVAVLPGTLLLAAETIAQRLRKAVSALEPVPACRLSISLGVAAYRPGESAAELLERADALHYRAKRAGGDRACAEGSGLELDHVARVIG